MTDRRPLVTRAWLAGSVAYGFLRIALVWTFLAKYGVNPILYGSVEISSSFVYGWASARVVLDVVDETWERLRLHAPVAVCAYLAPDACILAMVGSLPSGILRTLISIVVASATITTVGLVRTVRRSRAARR